MLVRDDKTDKKTRKDLDIIPTPALRAAVVKNRSTKIKENISIVKPKQTDKSHSKQIHQIKLDRASK